MKPTSPRNLLKTLRSGGTALLFPGGAREVFKRHLQILAAGYFFLFGLQWLFHFGHVDSVVFRIFV